MWGVKTLLKPAINVHMARRQLRVSVVGAMSELGQAASLLLRAEPAVTALSVHDTSPTHKLFVDLAHIPLGSTIECYSGADHLVKALNDADLILAIAGTDAHTSPEYNNSTIAINKKSNFIKQFAEAVSMIRPMPFIGIATEPLSIFVPLAAEIIKRHGEYDAKRIFGISSVDALRARSLYAETCGVSADAVSVPVICGHSPRTVVPLFSQARPARELTPSLVQTLTDRVRCANADITAEKQGEPPTLSAALDILRFTRDIGHAFSGKTPRIHAFVENNDFGTLYFAGRMPVSKAGAGDMERFNDLSAYEIELLESSIGHLRDEVMTGKQILEMDS